jgi:hypothetical protein
MILTTLKNRYRQEWAKRLDELAGVSDEGGILPPPADMKIDRRPNPWWKPIVIPIDNPDDKK